MISSPSVQRTHTAAAAGAASSTNNTNSNASSTTPTQHHGGSIALVKRLHALAADVDNQPVVARRGVLPSLLLFLQNAEPEVRHCAAETLVLLSSHPDNPECLCRERGLVQIVVSAYRSSASSDPILHRLCGNIVRNLGPALENATNNGNNGDAGSSSPPSAGGADGNANSSSSLRRVASTRVRQTTFGGSQICRSVQLFLAELTAARRQQLVECLHSTRGVVSYTIDLPSQQLTVFLATATQNLLSALKDEGFTRVEVLCESEVQANNSGNDSTGGNGENNLSKAPPGYLDSTSSSGNNATKRGAGPASDYKRSLVLHGIEQNSLAARIARNREEEQRGSMLGSFFTTLKNVFW